MVASCFFHSPDIGIRMDAFSQKCSAYFYLLTLYYRLGDFCVLCMQLVFFLLFFRFSYKNGCLFPEMLSVFLPFNPRLCRLGDVCVLCKKDCMLLVSFIFFRYWYKNGCLFTEMLSVFILTNPCRQGMNDGNTDDVRCLCSLYASCFFYSSDIGTRMDACFQRC